jgi:hypothetical protein
VLQGGSEVCPIWNLSSSVLFKVLDEQLPPAVFPSPRPEVQTAHNSKGFADDVTLWETSQKKGLEEVLAIMQTKAQAWE